jgi:hypothetical protein
VDLTGASSLDEAAGRNAHRWLGRGLRECRIDQTGLPALLPSPRDRQHRRRTNWHAISEWYAEKLSE